MKAKLFLLLLFVLPLTLSAQDIVKSLQEIKVGEGVITIHQDPRITLRLRNSMLDSLALGSQRVIKHPGYRIQIYAGNNSRRAKNEALEQASVLNAKFPTLVTYTHFMPPRWTCRVGDFLSFEEADAMLREIKKTSDFKELSIVRDKINITY